MEPGHATKASACSTERLRIFVLGGSDSLGTAISQDLRHPLSLHEEREFEDGEHKARPLDAVRGCDVYVLHSLHGDATGQSANDKLCRLLFFIGSLKDSGAARITAIAPYLCYARKDRRTKPNDPVTTRYVAALFEAVGTDRIVTLEVHNEAAFENAFRCPAIALSAAPVLLTAMQGTLGDEPLCVISPDLGGGKRADLFRQALESAMGRPVGNAFAEKHRSAGVVSGDLFAGEVSGSTCIIVDDLISTGGTVIRAARAAKSRGARRVIACAAHGLFTQGGGELFADPAIDRIFVTDSVAMASRITQSSAGKLTIVSVAPLLSAIIGRLHEERALTDLTVF